MSAIDDLPPDQRAALQLLLGKGRSYEELARMLRIEPDAVRRRALAGLEALGPRDGELPPPDRRADIADYLLGQTPASRREEVRHYLQTSPPARAWTRVVLGELRPVAGDALPDLPPERAAIPGTPTGRRAAEPADEETASARPGRLPPVVSPEGDDDGDGTAASGRSSRVGGAVLLGGIAILIAAAILIALNVGGGSSSSSGNQVGANTQVATSPPTGTTPTNSQPKVAAQVNMVPPAGAPHTRLGLGYLITLRNQWVLEMAAQGLPASTPRKAYGVWLTGGPQGDRFLGYPQTPVGKDGRLRFQYVLPVDPTTYTRLLLTQEPDQGANTPVPAKPGQIVLSGPITKPKKTG